MFPESFKILVITLSDRAARGEYEDLSGPVIITCLEKLFNESGWKYSVEKKLIPDDRETLHNLMAGSLESYNLIVTTGGTGIGPRDITVDTVKPFLTTEIPGIMELIRVKYGLNKPNAVLSRGIAGIAGKALVFTLPGSVKAVKEYMAEISSLLLHTIQMQYGIDSHGNPAL